MNRNSRRLFCSIFLILVIFSLHTAFASITQQTKRKIDPALFLLFNNVEKRLPAVFTSIECAMNENEPGKSVVGVLLKSSADIRSDVQSLGGTVGSQHGDIYTAVVPVLSIPELAEKEYIDYIEASRTMENNLDFALAKTGATILHDLTAPANLTGKGVIIGFTDTGIDFKHEDFKDESGNSRVLFIWDQSLNGTRPDAFSYGVEFDQDDINSGSINHKDENGHGSHVAGIAAGDGSSTGKYRGVAPDANIIMVANRGDDLFNRGQTTRGTLDGYDYIRGKANELNMPHVINTSQGTTMGPHDGTTLFEQAINNDVAHGSVIVVSAGNYGNDRLHAEAVVDPDSGVTLVFSIAAEGDISGNDIEMDIWFETNDYLEIQVGGPTVGYQDIVSILQNRTFDTADGRISVISELYSPLNMDNRIMVIIDNDGSGAAEIKRGTWRVKLTQFPGNGLPDGGEIDAWFERNDPVGFTRHVDYRVTMGMPSCADSAITVGSYNNRTGSIDDISDFSGRGPRRDGALKPDITSLGGGIISVLSSESDGDPIGDDFHTQLSGTSMSTPFVTGAVALLLQADPSLKPGQIKKILMNSARADLFTGDVPNFDWGYGKLDILSALRSYVSTAEVSGVVTDSLSGDGIAAEIVFELANQPYSIDPVVVSTNPETGEFSALVMPVEHNVTITPILPYPEIQNSNVPISADSMTVFNANLNRADILLVNDDPLAAHVNYYKAALDSLGLTYAVWRSAESGAVAKQDMQHFDAGAVVWYTGDATVDVLTLQEQESIGDYLDRGGRLFLTGQNIAESLAESGFLSDRLHVSFVSNIIDPTIDGISGDPVGNDLMIITAGQYGASNQTSPDVIEPIGLSEPCVMYDTTKALTAGVRISDPLTNSRIVFFSFGLEAVNTRVGLPFNTREDVLQAVLNWLFGETKVIARGAEDTNSPLTFALSENYPNPFAATGFSQTWFSYQLPREMDVEIYIYNILGQRVKTLVNQKMSAGTHKLNWSGRDDVGNLMPSGIYFYSIRTQQFIKSRKMVLIQ